MLDRFAAAIQDADGSALAELLREDVAPEMPPLLTWFTGRQTVAGSIAAHFLTEPGGLRLVPVTATGIARIVAFQDPGLFGSFGLPQEYGTGSGPAPAQD